MIKVKQEVMEDELIDFSEREGEEEKISYVIKERINFCDFQDFVESFNGEKPVEVFFEHFENAAELLELTPKQKLMFLTKSLSGIALKFVKSKPVFKNYEELKTSIIIEFKTRINPADIHEKLSKSKKQPGESYIDFFYKMKQVAAEASLDNLSIKKYIIDGVQESRTIDLQLRQCEDLESLRKTLIILDSQERSRRFLMPRFPMRPGLAQRYPMDYRNSIRSQRPPFYNQRYQGQCFQRPQGNSPNSPFCPPRPRNQSTPAFRTPVSRPRQPFRPSSTFRNNTINDSQA